MIRLVAVVSVIVVLLPAAVLAANTHYAVPLALAVIGLAVLLAHVDEGT